MRKALEVLVEAGRPEARKVVGTLQLEVGKDYMQAEVVAELLGVVVENAVEEGAVAAAATVAHHTHSWHTVLIVRVSGEGPQADQVVGLATEGGRQKQMLVEPVRLLLLPSMQNNLAALVEVEEDQEEEGVAEGKLLTGLRTDFCS